MINKSQKKTLSLIAGISGLIVGFWMIFVTKNNFGFIPSIIGTILLLWGREW
ncbi:MAG: hypothetical protein KKB88_00335 [Nanoarchaeota archaeon]|nr:hypothetical protein [Nanoarchaeota archaeon]